MKALPFCCIVLGVPLVWALYSPLIKTLHSIAKADCTGCSESPPPPCVSRWVLPDGTSLCLDTPDRFKQILDSFPECRQPSKLEAFEE